jgi:import inner membrane translocase subunit TIM50
MRSLLGPLRVSRGAISGRLMARSTPLFVPRINWQVRRYAEQGSKEPSNRQQSGQEPAKEPAKEPASSLLTEDILERAGMDASSIKKEEEPSSEPETDTEGGASEEQRQRWQGTAKKFSEKSSTDLRREKRSNFFYAALLGMALGGGLYFARDWEEDEQKAHPSVPGGYTVSASFERFKTRLGDVFNYFNEPIFEKLLPDPLPDPYGRPFTLVVSLDDLLVHSEWSREYGWRTAKRPGVDYFLGYLAQYYEVVIFSNKYQVYEEKTVAKLDPYRSSISYALFREATRYRDGKVIKDLANLNRDLGKVILLETDPDAYFLQPENAIPMKPWKGTPGDQELVRLIPFLEWIASQPIKDVRPILKSFEGTNVPEEYARREAIARKKFEEEWHKQNQSPSNNWAANFLGIKPSVPPTPMMPMDYIRQEGQKGYEAFQQYLAENGEKMLAEEKQREKELLNEQKFTLNKLVTEGLPTAEELASIQKQKEAEAQQAQKAHTR